MPMNSRPSSSATANSAAFVVDHVVDHIGARDPDRHHGGDDDGGECQRRAGNQRSDGDAPALVTERAVGRGREAGAIEGRAHDEPANAGKSIIRFRCINY